MSVRPIPKHLLIHTVMLHSIVGEERWGKEILDEGTKLERVRIEPSSKIVRDKNNAEVKLAAILFYDCKNSSPRDISFAEDNIIIFQGVKHKVQVVEALYDRKKLHHYELGLVGHA